MSATKRYLEDISVEIGYDGEINEHVLREAETRQRSVRDQVAKGATYNEDEFNVPMDGQVLCYLRCVVERDVQNLYDDPEGLAVSFGEEGDKKYTLAQRTAIGVAQQLDILKKAVATLHLDWDEVVEQESTPFERSRIEQILKDYPRT